MSSVLAQSGVQSDDVGIFVVRLVVDDGAKSSTPSEATITVGD